MEYGCVEQYQSGAMTTAGLHCSGLAVRQHYGHSGWRWCDEEAGGESGVE